MVEQRRARDWQGQQRDPSRNFDYGRGDAQQGRAQEENGWPEDYGRGFPGGDRGRGSGGTQQGGSWPDPQGERGYGPQSAHKQWFAQQGNSSGFSRGSSQRAGPYRGRGPKNYSRSDDRIRDDVCDALSEDGEVDASEIEVEVANGEVTLIGTVSSREQRRKAEDCADQISGVKHVQNNIRVSSTNTSGANQEGIGNMGSRGATGLGGQYGTGVPGKQDF